MKKLKRFEDRSAQYLSNKVDSFNRLYKVGAVVFLELDGGEVEQRKVTESAYVLGEHTAVAHFEGIRGCFDIDRVIGAP